MPPKSKVVSKKKQEDAEVIQDTLEDSVPKAKTKRPVKKQEPEAEVIENQDSKVTVRKTSTKSGAQKHKSEKLNKPSSKKVTKSNKDEEDDEPIEEQDSDLEPAKPVSKGRGIKQKSEKVNKPSKKVNKSTKNQEDDVEESSEEHDKDIEPAKEIKKGRGKKAKTAEVEDTNKNSNDSKAVKRRQPKNVKDEVTEPKKKKNTTTSLWGSINFDCDKKNEEGNTYNLKISAWNIGGLKSWVKKECLQYIDHEQPDIFCMQETKCNESKLPEEITELKDYKQYWCASKKDGYAGVGLLSRVEPLNVIYGIGDEDMDQDGRCITAEYDNFYVVCVYVPNSGRGLVTLPKRLKWNDLFKTFINKLNKKKPVIICGDMNVSHKEMDLARPKSNTKNAGFTPEERQGLTDFLENGYVDSFRALYPDQTDAYTFWTYMANARANNVGWRLDYFIVSENLMKKICDNVIRSEVAGSDHCPITLFLNL